MFLCSSSLIVSATDAASLVKQSLSKISVNYSTTDNYMNAFYKERVLKNHEAISVNEAVLDIEKISYTRQQKDRIAIRDLRGNNYHNNNIPFNVKLQGGPVSAIELDVVKNPFLGCLPYQVSDYYNFEYEESQMLHGKEFYVVSFNQKPGTERNLFRGKIFIDKESLAIGRIEYSMNIENDSWSYGKFVSKKPRNSDIRMVEATYVVSYREYNNKWYFDYSTSNISFNIQDRAEQTYDTYSINSQMAVTNLVADNFSIDKKEMVKSTDILADKANNTTLASDWDIYNLIMLLAINY